MKAHPYAEAWPLLGDEELALGTHHPTMTLVSVSRSLEHPGFFNVDTSDSAGLRIETRKPCSAGFVGFVIEHQLSELGRTTRTDLSWSTMPRSSRSPVSTGHIYFISDEDGYIKIGHSARGAQSRFDALQTASRQHLRIIGEIPGTLSGEHALHARFANERVRGEWFYPSVALTEYIADVIA